MFYLQVIVVDATPTDVSTTIQTPLFAITSNVYVPAVAVVLNETSDVVA